MNDIVAFVPMFNLVTIAVVYSVIGAMIFTSQVSSEPKPSVQSSVV